MTLTALPKFPTDLYRILSRIQFIDPVSYGRTRNYTDGSITLLSPYISRGVISTAEILESLVHRGFTFEDCQTLVRELAWRDYFQRVWQVREVESDLRSRQSGVSATGFPKALAQAATGIEAVDASVHELYDRGYMHNHCRMYTAAIACNLAGTEWLEPARWMYYHLLDGDWGSNACSWQWVAGTFSSKKYYANQENINQFTNTAQKGTWLDVDYEFLPRLSCPDYMRESAPLDLHTNLPEFDWPEIDPTLPVCIYNYYNLDPNWRSDQPYNRILLLEPEIFQKYPVSDKCLDFLFGLAANIPGMLFYTGSWKKLSERLGESTVYFKEHPLNRHYRGTEDARDWLDAEVDGFHPSFSSYWKKIEPGLREAFRINALIRS